jgi:hypothetical protein
MKRREYLVSLLKKSGHKADEIETFITDLEAEIEDTDANTRLSGLLTAEEAVANDAIYNRVKGRARSEALDPIDTEMAPLEAALPADLKAKYIALGKNSYEKVKFLVNNFQEVLGQKTGDKNYDDLKATFDDLQGKLTTDYVEKQKYADLEGQLSGIRKENIEGKLIGSARSMIKNEDILKQRHFNRNFLQDVNDLLTTGIGDKKVKGVLDYTTGKIMRQDSPDQPLMIGNDLATIEALAAQAVAFGEYDKGYIAPKSEPIRLPNGDQSENKISEARRRNAEFESKGY